MSGVFVTGLLGVGYRHEGIDFVISVLSIGLIALVVILSLYGNGLWRSFSVLIAIIVGWASFILLRLAPSPHFGAEQLIAFPYFFAWGYPTFDLGVVITSCLTAIILLSNLIASIAAMAQLTGQDSGNDVYNRGVFFTGIADVLAGLGATVGFVPYTAAAGLVSITGLAARAPFIIACLFMIGLGLLPPVGVFLASLPLPVGYAVLFASFCQLLGFGLMDYQKLALNNRNVFVLGISLLIGTGVMFLPSQAFASLPGVIRYLLGNGLIMGMIVCLMLEHLLLKTKK